WGGVEGGDDAVGGAQVDANRLGDGGERIARRGGVMLHRWMIPCVPFPRGKKETRRPAGSVGSLSGLAETGGRERPPCVYQRRISRNPAGQRVSRKPCGVSTAYLL